LGEGSIGVFIGVLEYWSIGVLEKGVGSIHIFFWEFISRFTQTFSFLMNGMIECYNFFRMHVFEGHQLATFLVYEMLMLLYGFRFKWAQTV